MPQGPEYIFGLQSENFDFWRLDSNNMIQLGAQPYWLRFSPDGWNGIKIDNVINETYKGTDRAVTFPMSYVGDGARIVKSIAYSRGTGEKVFLIIGKQELYYAAAPTGSLKVLTGSLPFDVGLNTGMVIGTPGETVYLKLTINGTDVDYIDGNTAGINYVNIHGVQTQIIPVLIPPSGNSSYYFYFINTSGTATATLTVTNSLGTTSAGYGYYYSRLYRGEIDWSTFDHAGAKVTCISLEDGLTKYLRASDKTIFELDMNDPEAINVKMDGIPLHEETNFAMLPDFEIEPGSGTFLLPMDFLNNEGDHTGIEVDSQHLEFLSGSLTDFIKTDNKIFKNFAAGPIITTNFNGVLEITGTQRTASLAQVRFRFMRSNQDFSNQDLYAIGGPSNFYTINAGQTFQVPINIDVVSVPGEQIQFQCISQLTGTSFKFVFTENSRIKAKFITRHPTTYIKAFRPQYVFEQLISRMTEGKYTAALAAYFVTMKNKVITSGNAIRGLADAKMKISWEMLFKFFDSIDTVGMIDRNNRTVDFAQENDLYDFTSVIDLEEPELNSLRIVWDKNVQINSLKIGFPEIRNDVGVLNGNDEVNSSFLFTTDATNLVGNLEKISPIRCAPLEIEKIRTVTQDKNTTDYKNDNDNYGLHIEDTLQPENGTIPAHYRLDRSLNGTATGILEPSGIFNLWFSPKRSIIRNGVNITGRFYKSNATVFKFRSADKNKNLVCDGITESADFNVGSLAPAKVQPWLIYMTVPMPFNIINMLNINPLQVYRFPFQGQQYYGTLKSISYEHSTKKAQSIILRSASVNDLTKFIEYNG